METRRFPTGERRVFARVCAKASTGTRPPCFGGENVVKSNAMNTTTLTFEQRYVQARRRFIAADFANLNDMQRQADWLLNRHGVTVNSIPKTIR